MLQMISEFVAAVGGAVTTVLTKDFTTWVRERTSAALPIDKGRRRGLTGVWQGEGKDLFVENGGPSSPMKATFSLKCSGKRILGHADVTVPALNHSVGLSLKGVFCSERLIQASYRSSARERIQFGVVLLELSDTGEELHGHYSGYSPMRRCLVVGEFNLTKITTKA